MSALLLGLPALTTTNAATYYVATNGIDGATGTIDAPWASLYYATRTRGYLQPGDTLFVRAGVYRGNTNCIDLGNGVGQSGTSIAPITVRAYPGENVIITDITSPEAGLILKNKAFWTFRDLTWSNNFSSAVLDSVTNFVFTNCTFRTMRPDADTGDYRYANVGFVGPSQSNQVYNCTFADWGTIFTNATKGYQYQIAGTHISFGEETTDPPCWYNLVRGCTFANGGHDCFQLSTAYTVIQSNIFHQEPYLVTNVNRGGQYYNFGNPRVEPNLLGKWGARVTKPGDAGDYQIDMRNVFEYNQLYYASFPPDSQGAFGFELGTRQSIYRFNTIAFCEAAGIYFNTSGTTTLSTSNAVYGNVIFDNGLCYLYGNTNAYGFSYGMTMSTYEGRRTNNFIVNNILWGNHPSDIDPTIYKYQAIRTNWIGDARLPNPQFVSTNGLGYVWNPAYLPDFHLQASSPCIDAGTWLAYVTSPTGGGTSFTLDNSLYFSDGNKIVPGDTIQLQGQTNRAVILFNDFTNNIITFTPALTWTNGQGVALAYYGAAPDMGAFEYSPANSEQPPAVPTGVHILTNGIPR